MGKWHRERMERVGPLTFLAYLTTQYPKGDTHQDLHTFGKGNTGSGESLRG